MKLILPAALSLEETEAAFGDLFDCFISCLGSNAEILRYLNVNNEPQASEKYIHSLWTLWSNRTLNSFCANRYSTVLFTGGNISGLLDVFEPAKI